MRVLEKRVGMLERTSVGACSFVCIYNHAKESREEAVARWEGENGPLGTRQPIIVNFVDAAL